MTNLPSAVYHQLVITASSPGTEIWLGADDGHFVQKAVGELRTSLLAGDYTVEFKLGGQTYPLQLRAASRYTEKEIEAGPRCPRPVPRLIDDKH